MTKVKKLNAKPKEPNYDKFFENVVVDCGKIIVDAMKSSNKGDDLSFKCQIGTKKEKHDIQIIIKKSE
ncbi:MAG: hypothetical protein QQN55_01100 [Nitrosopumilus sp.]